MGYSGGKKIEGLSLKEFDIGNCYGWFSNISHIALGSAASDHVEGIARKMKGVQ